MGDTARLLAVQSTVDRGHLDDANPARVDVRQHRALPRPGRAFVWAALLAVFALAGCAAHPSGRKDLLTFLEDGTTSKDSVRARIGSPHVWAGGHVWTYRIGEDKAGFFLPTGEHKSDWLSARYSLVLEFDSNDVLRRHALVDVKIGA